jgi:hypothetical protein
MGVGLLVTSILGVEAISWVILCFFAWIGFSAVAANRFDR